MRVQFASSALIEGVGGIVYMEKYRLVRLEKRVRSPLPL